jgi:hypothetical protein
VGISRLFSTVVVGSSQLHLCGRFKQQSDSSGSTALRSRAAISLPALPDSDADGVVDSLDNCALVSNANQKNSDDDSFGDACDLDDLDDLDDDNDSLADADDNCSKKYNPDQADNDGDGRGNVCDFFPVGGGPSGC